MDFRFFIINPPIYLYAYSPMCLSAYQRISKKKEAIRPLFFNLFTAGSDNEFEIVFNAYLQDIYEVLHL
ncbi:hypothetical protein L1275_001344 [Flavobacterium sp. HSC-61S13]|nr:hypothetical protein [Flavobacterium sp. HSC-61S13]